MPEPERSPRSRQRRWISRTLLVASSVTASLILAETALRLFHPKYEFAADSDYTADNERIWARKPRTVGVGRHPDTGARHLIVHNSVALRQHRDFDSGGLSDAFNVAYFGDSYIENRRLPSQFTSNEILDYLLNQRVGRANTLNFGVDGYGTDQEFIYYNSLPDTIKRELDHVFYVHCGNDLRNLYENQLVSLDDSGNLVFAAARQTSRLTRLLSRAHLTYLVLDVLNVLGMSSLDPDAAKHANVDALLMQEHYRRREGRVHSEQADAMESNFYRGKIDEIGPTWLVFNAVLRAWKAEVETNGGKFAVVLLPSRTQSSLARFFPPEIPIVNLYEEIRRDFPGFEYADVKFTKDGHWNERGNILTAYYLYRFLEREQAFKTQTEKTLATDLSRYLYAFDGGEHLPARWAIPQAFDAAASRELAGKYLQIELELRRRGQNPLD